MSTDPATAFIAGWSTASPSERANSQLFLSELCDLLGLPHPSPAHEHLQSVAPSFLPFCFSK